jgi:hypothetical protein
MNMVLLRGWIAKLRLEISLSALSDGITIGFPVIIKIELLLEWTFIGCTPELKFALVERSIAEMSKEILFDERLFEDILAEVVLFNMIRLSS